MAKAAPPPDEPFDLDKLRELIELMERHDLTEVSLRRGDRKWRLRRGPQEVVQFVPGNAPSSPAAAPTGSSDATAPASSTPGVFIKSPTVGTYYSAPSPDDPPFVQVGSRVQPDSVVCIVEAMKVFNQITADVGGTIAEVLVNNGDPVEFGQPLFRVTPG